MSDRVAVMYLGKLSERNHPFLAELGRAGAVRRRAHAAQAHRRIMGGHTRGKIVLEVS